MFRKFCAVCLLAAGSVAGHELQSVSIAASGSAHKSSVRTVRKQQSHTSHGASEHASPLPAENESRCSHRRCTKNELQLTAAWQPVQAGRKHGIPPEWKRVAFLFSGHHYKVGGSTSRAYTLNNKTKFYSSMPAQKSTDWRVTRDAWRANVLDVLEKAGVKVDVYLHTWPSHQKLERELVADFKPKRWVIDNQSSCRAGRDSREEAMRLVRESGEEYDGIILTRFELVFQHSLDTFSIDPKKFNMGYRMHRYCMNDDLMYILPQHMMALRWPRSGHGFLSHLPMEWTGRRVDEHGCYADWQDHVHLMSEEFGLAGGDNALGSLSRELATVEDGPYYTGPRSRHNCIMNGRELA